MSKVEMAHRRGHAMLPKLHEIIHRRRSTTLHGAVIVLTLAAAVGVYGLLPASMDELSRRTAAIFVIAAVFWATEVLPLYATSLCVIGLEILLLAGEGGLGPDAGARTIGVSTFLEPFGSGVIMLFLGGFLLARAASKHGVDRAVAAAVLRPIAHRPMVLISAILGLTAFFSMWMSNTATTAMMLAVIAPILASMDRGTRFATAVILAVPLGANIGGVATPIGTPPNAIALAALRKAGYEISFLEWMLFATPLAVGMLVLAGGVLYVLYRPRVKLPHVEIASSGNLSSHGWATVVVTLGAMALWLSSSWHGIADAAIALIAAGALTAMKVLDRQDVDSIDWNVLILMWGGLSLGKAMEVSGLVDHAVALPILQQTGLVLAGVVVALGMGLSTFMSNTAAANLIIPMAMAMSVAEGGRLGVLTALSCSFAMALPVSTPPNAMAFATGRLTTRALLVSGGTISVLAIGALLVGYLWVLPWVLVG